ncbi:LysM peptidoglycan-binding domain-containing protein [Planctomicrobium piriforme]|uniref:LysM repeat-containing protein n=1 Tax=Planctomicrobium piriforme TaxID=1576369 RepID=A0A1I3PDS2_9PLAN|nr:LysM domain-containing protein [Planctomicrobium piriforme]SFJ19623.1 LysM repeat-containing protein [Planctomicrobium piriforme]
MRHDAKLGLALGMLVIGFAVAFCFPRQPEPTAWPKLEVPEPIADSDLDFLPIRAYQPKPADAAPQQVVTHEPNTAEQPVGPVVPPPNPISPPVVETPTVAVAASVAPAANAEAQVKTYRVLPGDTLSGLASKFLGSSARFLEIYEANQELLGSPDRLQVGMELKIPPKVAPAIVAEKPPEAATTPAEAKPAGQTLPPYSQVAGQPEARH